MDNKYMNSKSETSQAVRKIPKLKSYIAHAIDEIEDLRKYCINLDKAPLEDIGIDYAGNEVKHETLPDTIISNNGDREQKKIVIYRELFDNKELDELKCYIFIGCPTTDINNSMNRYNLLVEVLVPQEYNILIDDYSERIYEIGDLICQRLDNHRIQNDERYADYIGNLEFKADNRIYEGRLSNTNTHISLKIPFIVKGSGNTFANK